ncbi:MAG: ATP-binding protein [Thermoleophilia bacterium]
MSTPDRFRPPGRRPHRRLFTKYLVVLVGLVGAAVLVTSAATLYFTYRDAETSAARLLEETAAQQARGVASAARFMSLDVSQALPASGDTTLAARRAAYSAALGERIKQLTYVDRTGTERLRVGISGPAPSPGRDLSADPVVRQALENAQWGPRDIFGPVRYPEDGGGRLFPQLQIAVGEPGDPGGATIAEVDPFFLVLEEFLSPTSDVTVYLVDSRGRRLAHPMVLEEYNATGDTRHPDISGLPQVAAAIDGAAPGPGPLPGEGPDLPARAASWERDLEGNEVLSASAPVAGLGWQVLAERRRGDVLAPVYSAAVRTGIVLVVFLILAVLASALLARRMVRPITQIEAGARRIGDGALSERIDVRTGDELEDLADTFNEMSARLQDLHADLEGRVVDRTRDLTSALEQNASLLRALEERGRELEVASRHKSEFIATMSHELRTPLNAVIGFSEVLRERMFGELNERQADYVEDIHRAGRHLLALIDDILDLAKVEAGRMDLELTEVDVGECLEMGLLMVRERAARRGVRVSTHMDPGVGPVIADGRRLKQVVFNLLANAVRFTPEGGQVQASAHMAGDEVTISVSDTGPGIADQDRERIFETFRQAGGGGDGEGSGLGLPLSRALVELHGGRLWVESGSGEGSTFVLTLPPAPIPARG